MSVFQGRNLKTLFQKTASHCNFTRSSMEAALHTPALELQATILGTRLAQSILENHQLPIHQRFYWTDSSTVLHWINSDSRRYRPYVACRIGEILTSTNPSEWKKVPTMQNVADKATKWGNGPCFDPEDPWYQGPQFLWGPEEFWPEQNWKRTDAAEELRPVLVNRRVKIEPVIDVKRFSRWEKLQRTVAYVLKFGGVMSEDTSLETPINSVLLCKAEVKLWKMVQLETFPEELAVLQSRHSTKPSGAVPVSNFYHRRCHHRNQETVVNGLRQLVYIPGLRNLIRKVTARCQMCKVYNASLGSPKIGPLPQARLEAILRPFTYTGLDYYGPVTVKVGRKHAKRWVALFTCLTTRAIHLEVAHSLSSMSCKMCIRRFIARRGAPSKIYSDKGTNFHGAANELQDQIQQCAETFTNTTTKWRTKWFRDTKPIEVGDLVFVVNENKRNTWIRGQIVEVIRSVIRQALVRTEAGVIQRPAVKLAVIEVAEDGKVEASGPDQTQPYGPGNFGTATSHPQSP
ncbi:uncharacterized protein LOC135704937 [Ochlerotatus camptorhynchus]|uniref:uncharacterized protein LOC135704937 n=1 Tax=Ochlerotatus camptorhynchus TaxID=644619 RepID=UPI0031D58087